MPTTTASATTPVATLPPLGTPSPAYDIPRASDFTLKLRTTAKQCFGSAGCNVTLRVILQVNGSYNFNPARTYDLRFKIIGDESGPLIDTLQLTGKRYTTHEEFISTNSEHVVPIVKIIGITPA